MRIFLLTTAAAAALVPAAAFAQAQDPATPVSTAGVQANNAADQGAAPATADDAQGLQTVTITAQRREENLQRAAVAVDVVTSADLRNSGTTNAAQLTALAPALVVEPSSTGNLIFLRGVGNFTVVPTSDPAIAFNIDGEYIGRPTSTTSAFYDLSRIEVLKGPQGTLYGRNATGGAINVIPEHPHLGETSGYGSISYGNYSALTIEGALNVRLGDNGAFRISGIDTQHDGYLHDGTMDDKSQAFRAQLMARLTPHLTVRLAADYAHLGGFGYSVSYQGLYVLNPVTGVYTFNPVNLPRSEGLYTPAAQAFRQTDFVGLVGRRLNALDPRPYQNNNYYGAHAEVNWDVGIGTLTFLPAWRTSHLNYLSDAAAFFAKQRETDDQSSAELRLVGNRTGIFDYVLGAYYYHESETYHQVIDILAQASWADQRLVTESWAPFGRLTAHLTDRLRLVGGIRYTHDHKTFASVGVSGTIVCNVRVAGVPSCPTVPLIPAVDSPSQIGFPFPPQGVPALPIGATGAIIARSDSVYNSRLSNERVTYRGAVEYDLAPHSLLYASYETGYRSGGFAASTGHETYQPEYLTAWTLGLKNRFWGNRLQLNIEGFLWNYRNQQVNHVGLDSTGRTSNFTDNIGSSRIYGTEIEAQALVTPTTLLHADLQYLHAENRSFIYTTGAQAPPLVGCPYALTGAVYTINCSGFPANNAPRWTVNVGAQQTIPMGRYQLQLSADTQYKSGRYITFYYLQQGYVDHSWQSNAQISFGPASERWGFSLFVRNIENNRTPVFDSPTPILNFSIVGTTAPRTYGARFNFHF